jgi:hypothetical protein
MKKLLTTLLLLGIAGLLGYMLQATYPYLRWISAVLSLSFGILSWSLFHLFVPARYFYRPKWRRLRLAFIPAIWILLVALLTIFLSRIPLDEKQGPHLDYLASVRTP